MRRPRVRCVMFCRAAECHVLDWSSPSYWRLFGGYEVIGTWRQIGLLVRAEAYLCCLSAWECGGGQLAQCQPALSVQPSLTGISASFRAFIVRTLGWGKSIELTWFAWFPFVFHSTNRSTRFTSLVPFFLNCNADGPTNARLCARLWNALAHL